MFQTVLMLFAAPQNLARSEFPLEKRVPSMATRARSVPPKIQNGAGDEVSTSGSAGGPNAGILIWLTVVGNALGFSVLMTGLWLVLGLAETLLA